MVLFYHEDPDRSEPVLSGEEFRHCIKVLRHKVGDLVRITDGKGHFVKARILSITKNEARLQRLDHEFLNPEKQFIILAIAAPKSRNRWEWLLEKSTEAGVNMIIPVLTYNSERKKFNSERAMLVMRSAALQSWRKHHPSIRPMLPLEQLAKQFKDDSNTAKILCHYNEQHPFLSELEITKDQILLLVGPEGDFSESEIRLLLANKFQAVNLSENRLRTETAAIIAVALLRIKS